MLSIAREAHPRGDDEIFCVDPGTLCHQLIPAMRCA
jgi:hypothetical protein